VRDSRRHSVPPPETLPVPPRHTIADICSPVKGVNVGVIIGLRLRLWLGFRVTVMVMVRVRVVNVR